MPRLTEDLLSSVSTRRSRRSLLTGALAGAAGVAGVAAIASVVQPTAAHAATNDDDNCVTPIPDILTIARTAEQLAVTFYTNGLLWADSLGISDDDRLYLKAALLEEQIHQKFFTAAGGKSLATTFSFPAGKKTFTDLPTFIATQQQLEGVFDSAFLAAVKEFGLQGHPELSQVAAQIACIEAEHRVLGRIIGNLSPADNWVFTPVLIGKVGDAPALVAKAGYLSPTPDNSFTYNEVDIDVDGVVYRSPFAVASCS
jgi:hypothetical protein